MVCSCMSEQYRLPTDVRLLFGWDICGQEVAFGLGIGTTEGQWVR